MDDIISASHTLSLQFNGFIIDHKLSPQSFPAARAGGRGLALSEGGVRRQRRDLRNRLPYEDQMMSYPAMQRGGSGVDDLYYQAADWRGRGLDQALQRLVERDQRREVEEEQRAGQSCWL